MVERAETQGAAAINGEEISGAEHGAVSVRRKEYMQGQGGGISETGADGIPPAVPLTDEEVAEV